MLNYFKARIKHAFVAIITMSIVAMAVFSPSVAEARGGGFSGGGRSFSSTRSFAAPRVVIAPRVIIAPRTVGIAPRIIVAGRPLVVVRPMYYPRPWWGYHPFYHPVIIPVDPGMAVPSDGQVQGPVAQEESHWVLITLSLIFLAVVLAGGAGCWGYCYYGGMDAGGFYAGEFLAEMAVEDMLWMEGDYL